jgi:hypothetical protein
MPRRATLHSTEAIRLHHPSFPKPPPQKDKIMYSSARKHFPLQEMDNERDKFENGYEQIDDLFPSKKTKDFLSQAQEGK